MKYYNKVTKRKDVELHVSFILSSKCRKPYGTLEDKQQITMKKREQSFRHF